MKRSDLTTQKAKKVVLGFEPVISTESSEIFQMDEELVAVTEATPVAFTPPPIVRKKKSNENPNGLVLLLLNSMLFLLQVHLKDQIGALRKHQLYHLQLHSRKGYSLIFQPMFLKDRRFQPLNLPKKLLDLRKKQQPNKKDESYKKNSVPKRHREYLKEHRNYLRNKSKNNKIHLREIPNCSIAHHHRIKNY